MNDWEILLNNYNDHKLVQFLTTHNGFVAFTRSSNDQIKEALINWEDSQHLSVDDFYLNFWFGINKKLLDFLWEKLQDHLGRKKEETGNTEKMVEKKEANVKENVSKYVKPQISTSKLQEINEINEKCERAVSMVKDFGQKVVVTISSENGFYCDIPVVGNEKMENLLVSLLEFVQKITIDCKITSQKNVQFTLFTIYLYQ